jgi:hypothetical protein
MRFDRPDGRFEITRRLVSSGGCCEEARVEVAVAIPIHPFGFGQLSEVRAERNKLGGPIGTERVLHDRPPFVEW